MIRACTTILCLCAGLLLPAGVNAHKPSDSYLGITLGEDGIAGQWDIALHALPEGSEVPWQRVINAKGEVSPRSEPGYENYQRHLLEEEGVTFDGRGRLDLDRFRWDPDGGDG